MIARYVADKEVKSDLDKYFVEVDITEAEMKDIVNGTYPESKIVAYKLDENGKTIPGSEISVTVSIGLLV